MKKVTATEGQTIQDLAIQVYGCYEGIIPFCADNNLSVTGEITPGQQFAVRDEVPELTTNNKAIAAHFAANKIIGNSGWIPAAIGQFLPSDFDNDFVNN